MAQFFGTEIIKDLTKASLTSLNWTPGSNLRIGGQAYKVTASLVLDRDTDIDTGSVATNTIYYVYSVVIGGVVSLKYSLSSEVPTGFAAYRKIGAFNTDATADIIGTSVKDKGGIGDMVQSMLNESQFILQNGAGWILCNGRNVAGSKYAIETGNSTIPDASGRFLRGKNNGSGTNPDGDVALGTAQAESTKVNGVTATTSTTGGTATSAGSHTHDNIHETTTGGGKRALSAVSFRTDADVVVNSASNSTDGAHTHPITGISSSTTVNGGGNETRSANLTVNIFIKIEDIEL